MPKQRDLFENQLARVVGRNVRRLREERKISVAQLADVLHCSVRAVQSYESGDRRMSLADAVRISYALSIDIDRLVLDHVSLTRALPRVSIEDIKS
jgi:transcriptional regulator with XRE-family HTH domain